MIKADLLPQTSKRRLAHLFNGVLIQVQVLAGLHAGEGAINTSFTLNLNPPNLTLGNVHLLEDGHTAKESPQRANIRVVDDQLVELRERAKGPLFLQGQAGAPLKVHLLELGETGNGIGGESSKAQAADGQFHQGGSQVVDRRQREVAEGVAIEGGQLEGGHGGGEDRRLGGKVQPVGVEGIAAVDGGEAGDVDGALVGVAVAEEDPVGNGLADVLFEVVRVWLTSFEGDWRGEFLLTECLKRFR